MKEVELFILLHRSGEARMRKTIMNMLGDLSFWTVLL